jgi:hypothetical protein
MADDNMGRDDLQQKVGGQGNKDAGQESPGRNPQDDQSTGQRTGSESQTRHGDTGSEGRKGRQGDDDI